MKSLFCAFLTVISFSIAHAGDCAAPAVQPGNIEGKPTFRVVTGCMCKDTDNTIVSLISCGTAKNCTCAKGYQTFHCQPDPKAPPPTADACMNADVTKDVKAGLFTSTDGKPVIAAPKSDAPAASARDADPAVPGAVPLNGATTSAANGRRPNHNARAVDKRKGKDTIGNANKYQTPTSIVHDGAPPPGPSTNGAPAAAPVPPPPTPAAPSDASQGNQ